MADISIRNARKRTSAAWFPSMQPGSVAQAGWTERGRLPHKAGLAASGADLIAHCRPCPLRPDSHSPITKAPSGKDLARVVKE